MEPGLNGKRRRSRAEWTAGVLSLIAGAIHGGVTPDHFAEWWGYGIFFIFAAAAQVLFGLALLTDAINPQDTGDRWREWLRAAYWLGIIGNVLIIALYTVTRTVGIPFFGPEAGEVEGVAPIDIVSKIVEVALIVTLVVLLWRGEPKADGHRGSGEPASNTSEPAEA